ncbi:pyruvate synthase subunit beta, partial [Candidatus Poribacteria bacterium]
MRLTLSEEELISPGHRACQGCGGAMAMRYALKALGKDTMVVLPACCWSIIDGEFPHSALQVPLLHTAFETAAAASSGVRAALKARGRDD